MLCVSSIPYIFFCSLCTGTILLRLPRRSYSCLRYALLRCDVPDRKVVKVSVQIISDLRQLVSRHASRDVLGCERGIA